MKRQFIVTIERHDGKDNDFESADIYEAITSAWPYTFGNSEKAALRVIEMKVSEKGRATA